MLTDQLAISKADFTLTATYSEFRQKAHLVPVVPRRDPQGRLKWECRDNLAQPDSFGALRQFMFNCMRHYEVSTGAQLIEAEAKEWVDQSVSRFLDPVQTRIDGLYYAIGPDNRVLILYRVDCGPLTDVSRETILGTVWHIEQDEAAA